MRRHVYELTWTRSRFDAGGKLIIEGDEAKLIDNYFCFCARPSPVPCCNGCGVGPCAQEPHFKKQSDTVFVGTEKSQCAAGMCASQCHNLGDKIEVKDGKMEWWAGNSPFYPPCFHNKLVATIELPKGGGPTCDEMDR